MGTLIIWICSVVPLLPLQTTKKENLLEEVEYLFEIKRSNQLYKTTFTDGDNNNCKRRFLKELIPKQLTRPPSQSAGIG